MILQLKRGVSPLYDLLMHGGDFMRGFGVTDVGQRRTVNQDSFIIKQTADDRLLAVVCDGMGGAAGGLEASSTAAGTFAAFAEAELEKLGDGAPLKAQKAERLLPARGRCGERSGLRKSKGKRNAHRHGNDAWSPRLCTAATYTR